MKIKDCENIRINNIKVKLPDFWFNSVNTFDSDIPREVWLVGPMMGDWFVKINREDKRVYPLFTEYIPYSEISEWEVVEIYKE
jgi:hypothetical protein